MKKGFTLMEMLAVVLLVALVLSFAVPAYRVIRFDVRNGQARVAVKKLAEAVKNYRRDSRGFRVMTCFTPTAANSPIQAFAQAGQPESCMTPGATGVPMRSLDMQTARNAQLVADNQASQLFACGYLSYKDFVGLPYTFCTFKTGVAELAGVADPADLQAADLDCADNDPNCDAYLAVAFSQNAAQVGAKYTLDKGFLFVDGRMEARDTYED